MLSSAAQSRGQGTCGYWCAEKFLYLAGRRAMGGTPHIATSSYRFAAVNPDRTPQRRRAPAPHLMHERPSAISADRSAIYRGGSGGTVYASPVLAGRDRPGG